METVHLRLKGMGCASCAGKIERAIQSVPGVVECSVNFGAKQATVKYSAKQTNSSDIARAVADLGYSAHPLQEAG